MGKHLRALFVSSPSTSEIADLEFLFGDTVYLVEAGELARVGLLGREHRARRALRRHRPALVCPVSIVLWQSAEVLAAEFRMPHRVQHN